MTRDCNFYAIKGRAAFPLTTSDQDLFVLLHLTLAPNALSTHKEEEED